MASVLRGQGGERGSSIFIEHEGNQMVRSGPHKLVRQHTEPAWQLYDMDRDRSEMHDLSPEMPERFVELAQAYSHWESQAHVIPWERGQRYMSYHGFRNFRPDFFRTYEDALAKAGPDGIVDGDAIGD